MFAATRLYGLIPLELALIGSLAAALGAAYLGGAHDAEIIAVLALIAVLGAPPVLGAAPNLVTLALHRDGPRRVRRAGPVSDVALAALDRIPLSAPQLASWLIGDAAPAIGFAAAAIFWFLNVIAAGGEEYLRPKNQPAPGSASLLLANAAFFDLGRLHVLAGPNEFLRGPFLIAVAFGHVVVGGIFLLRDGDRHPFGMLAAATGVAALAMAAPVQFGGPPVPIAWAAEATALAWLASRRAHPQAALGAAILGVLALAHLFLVEYPVVGSSPVTPFAPVGSWPFVNGSGLTLAFIVGSAAVAGWFLRLRAVVAVLAAVSVLAIAAAASFELVGPGLVAVWVALTLGAIAFNSFVVRRLANTDRRVFGCPSCSATRGTRR